MGKKNHLSNLIAGNPKARHDYMLHEQMVAGLVLEGWEVKALRASRAQLKESYVLVKDGEAWLLNTHISPLTQASTHKPTNPVRPRKLLLNRKELNQLQTSTSQKGFTVVALSMQWQQQYVKCTIALAKGKKKYDKRVAEKEKTWARERDRSLKDQRH